MVFIEKGNPKHDFSSKNGPDFSGRGQVGAEVLQLWRRRQAIFHMIHFVKKKVALIMKNWRRRPIFFKLLNG